MGPTVPEKHDITLTSCLLVLQLFQRVQMDHKSRVTSKVAKLNV